ncbi:hypothetical protein [Marinobacter mobilis]|uniref:hypothetical protein n=1 Tax=Marinobacter mobilis TaxID=488533 RepID=UPI0035C6AD11
MAPQVTDNCDLHLVFWKDSFTVLGVHRFQATRNQEDIYRLTLHCRGKHVSAFLREAQAARCGVPELGTRVSASLRLRAFPSGRRMMVESLALPAKTQ